MKESQELAPGNLETLFHEEKETWKSETGPLLQKKK
jgi:hypothetical protein